MSLAYTQVEAPARANALAVDGDGFLLDRRAWDRATAQRLAGACGLGTLDQTQWLIIDFVRDRYFRLGALPPMRNLCRKLGVERDSVKRAFGSCRQLCQVAGLPNPGCEALSYMD